MTMLPPPQFDHPPSIPVVEHVLTRGEVHKFCVDWGLGSLPPPGTWLGCARRLYQGSQLVCVVYRIDDPRVRRHELGHCNGWPPNHSVTKEAKEAPPPPKPVPISHEIATPTPERAKTFEEAWQRSIERNGPPDVLLKQVLEKAKAPETK